MPIYTYRCASCKGLFDTKCPVEARDSRPPCPRCRAGGERVFVPLNFNMNGASAKHDGDDITQWQFKHLDDKAWRREI